MDTIDPSPKKIRGLIILGSRKKSKTHILKELQKQHRMFLNDHYQPFFFYNSSLRFEDI